MVSIPVNPPAGHEAAARTREPLWNVISLSVGRFTAAECANYFVHCGYPIPQSGR
jgi:hypothetical protein